jgi:hypothetical protein
MANNPTQTIHYKGNSLMEILRRVNSPKFFTTEQFTANKPSQKQFKSKAIHRILNWPQSIRKQVTAEQVHRK